MNNLHIPKSLQGYPVNNVHRHVLPLLGEAEEMFVVLEYIEPGLGDLWPEELLQNSK